VGTPYSAVTIAKWFLAWAEDIEEAHVSNLKLQKLLYYAQGQHLARYGHPLFTEDIEAWSHGPVVASVYHKFKDFSKDNIVLAEDDEFSWADVDESTATFLSRVWNTYGGLAAWKLRDMTHQESPWQENFDPNVWHKVIPRSAIERYFASNVARD
jgi:uncharacterized phage-associated protein